MGMLEQTSWNSNGSTDCGGMCWNLLEFHHRLESIALPEFHCAGLCWIPSMEALEHAGTALRWNSQAGIQQDQFSDGSSDGSSVHGPKRVTVVEWEEWKGGWRG